MLHQLNAQGGGHDPLENRGEPSNIIAGASRSLSEDLPILPDCVFRLNAILSASPVDLNRLSRSSEADPGLLRQVIRCSNSVLFDLPQPVSTIEQAAVAVGTDNLRTLILACALVEYVSRHLDPRQEQAFWRHGFLTAVLSERIGRWTEYPQPEQAYLAGMLHNVGMLPLLRASLRDPGKWGLLRPEEGEDSLAIERKKFGIDHAKLGHWIGVSCGFPPPLVEVFEFHHDPQLGGGEAPLVSIVRAADGFCLARRRSLSLAANCGPSSTSGRLGEQKILAACLPGLSIVSRLRLAEALESDFTRTGEWLELGLMEPLAGSFPGKSDRVYKDEP